MSTKGDRAHSCLRIVPNRFEFDLWVMDMPAWWYRALVIQMQSYHTQNGSSRTRSGN